MQTYVLTGATSFIGSQLVRHLLGKGHRVIAVCRNHPRAVSKLGSHPALQIVEAQLADYGQLYTLIPRADVFIHLAWSGTGHDGRNAEDIQHANIRHALDALQSAAKMGCQLFADAGSQAEYGTQLGIISEQTPCHPFSAYGKAKLEAYRQCCSQAQTLGLKYLHLRIFSLFGVGDHPWTLVMTCVGRMLRHEAIDLSPCTQLWNFLNVSDAAEQVSRLCAYALSHPDFRQEVFNIASDDVRPLREFVEEMKVLCRSRSPLRYGVIQPANLVSLNPDLTKLRRTIGYVGDSTFRDVVCDIIQHQASNSHAI